MRPDLRASLAPAVCWLLGSALYLFLGDWFALAIAVWFAWSLTRTDDADHKGLRYLGWIMLVTIVTVPLARFAFVD
jgi:hypothetical protein